MLSRCGLRVGGPEGLLLDAAFPIGSPQKQICNEEAAELAQDSDRGGEGPWERKGQSFA